MDLVLPLKRKWFEQIKAGVKTEEYRLVNEYWVKRLLGRQYDRVILTLGYPSRDSHERRIVIPWRGYRAKFVTSEEWGNEPRLVFAISLTDQDSIQGEGVSNHQPTQQPQAIFSGCRTYRYVLWRQWLGGNGYAMFIGLNPSTADETNDDPTIRRCISYAKQWGFSGLCMTNLFGYRSTDPQKMLAVADPVGPDNDDYLKDCAAGAGVVVAAWGVHGTHLGRDALVRAMLPNLSCRRLTKGGHPGHPLYLPKSLQPTLMVTR